MKRRSCAWKEEARQMVEHAKVEAERHAAEARVALEESMNRRAELAEQRIARAEEEAMREVRQMAAALAVQAARRLIGETIDDQRADQMVEQSIQEVRDRLH
jgi:F-type H+-transporting ATPase subunit b